MLQIQQIRRGGIRKGKNISPFQTETKSEKKIKKFGK